MLDHKVLVIRLHNQIDWNLLQICQVEVDQILVIENINIKIRKKVSFFI